MEALTSFLGYVPTVASTLFEVAQSALSFCMENPATLFWIVTGAVSVGVGFAVRLYNNAR